MNQSLNSLGDLRIEDAMTCTTMKLALAAALMLSLGGARTADAQPLNKYKSNGAFVEIAGSDDTGCRYFYVYVTRGGTSAAPETYLYYDTFDGCANTWAYGSGRISNGSFVTSKNTATLKFSGTSSGSFYAEGERPTIALTLTKDGVFSQRSSGHVRYEYYDHVVQRHGTWTYYTATLSGTFGGSAVRGSATTGTGRDHYMEFDRGKE
jgi:hypothetical protein